MTYRQNQTNVSPPNPNSILKQNPPVSIISSTYDPSRVKSAMSQSLRNAPQMPPPPQSYPQPSTTSSSSQPTIFASQNTMGGSKNTIDYREHRPYEAPVNTSTKNYKSNSRTDSKSMDSIINPHPAQTAKMPSGLPVHPNSKEGQNIRITQQYAAQQQAAQQAAQQQATQSIIIQKVSDKIYNHFNVKYPSTIEASGFNKTTIVTIVSQAMKKEPLNEKTISKIIDIIDHKFKTTINSDNRQGIQYDTTNFSMDTDSQISVDKYLENYTNKVTILLDSSDKAIEADLPKKMAPVNDTVVIEPPEPFSEDFPIRDRDKQIDMMIPEIREYAFNIAISSNDRNIVKAPNPNNFTIEFAPAPDGGTGPQVGYIERAFHNIKACELMNVVVLDTSGQPDSSDAGGTSFPYLLLQFDELQNNYYGTNSPLSKAFAILTEYTQRGNYKYYRMVGDSSENTVSKIYNPRINLSKLTTRLLLPDGEPFNFGTAFQNDTSNCCIALGFRITTIQKNLATSFLNNA